MEAHHLSKQGVSLPTNENVSCLAERTVRWVVLWTSALLCDKLWPSFGPLVRILHASSVTVPSRYLPWPGEAVRAPCTLLILNGIGTPYSYLPTGLFVPMMGL